MTITRIWQATAEFQQILLEFTSIISVSFLLSSTTVKTGSWSYRFHSNAAAHKQFTVAYSQYRCGFHFQHNGPSPGDQPTIIAFGTAAAPKFIDLQFDGSTLYLFVDGIQVASAVALVQTTQFYHIGIDVKHDAAGWVTVYVDGIAIISYVGATNGQASIDRLGFNSGAVGMTWAAYCYVDDIFFDDTTGEAEPLPVPDRRFYLQKANGNGSVSDFIGSDTDSADNYLLVDDIPHDVDVTYVEALAAAERDLYTVAPFTLPLNYEIRAVIPWAIARKSDAEVGTKLSVVSKQGVSETVSVASDLGSSYGLISDRQIEKPGGGAWTETDVNAAEYGIESAGDF